MLKIDLDETSGIVVLEPEGRLSRTDFEAAAKVVDPFIEQHGGLKGIIIHVEHFPGWDDFSALVTHLKFVRDHHRKVSRVAISTDSPIGNLAEKIANHFVDATIRHFDFKDFEASKDWLSDL